MRLIVGVVAALALWGAGGAAFAEDHPYSVTVRSGVGYEFPNNEFGVPIVEENSIEGALTLAATHRGWTVSAAYLETDSDEEGYSLSLGYKHKDCLVGGLKCEAGVAYRDIGASNTVVYNAGVGADLPWQIPDRFEPSWSFGASYTDGDSTESSASVGVELPYKFNDQWSITGEFNIVHGFETGDTLPDWGISIDYSITPQFVVSAGYASQVVIDPLTEDELDFDRSAFVQLKYSFGS